MININFFEKKQVNILPYIVAGVFFILFLVMGIYFFFTHSYYSESIQDDKEWIQANASDVALSRRIEQIDERTMQAGEVQETLLTSQYPMSYVAKDLTALIQKEEERVQTYQLSEADQVVLVLEKTNVEEASSIIDRFNQVEYIDNVQLLRLENQQNDNNQYLFEVTLDINRERLHEVTEK